MRFQKALPLLLLLVAAGCALDEATESAESAEEKSGMASTEQTIQPDSKPITIEFQGELFSLQSQTRSDREIVNEYVLANEEIDGAWTKMLALREFPNVSDAQKAIGDLVGTVRGTYPEAPIEIFTNEETGQSIVEFTLTGSTGTELFVEYSLFRYEPSPSGTGTIAYQYVLRAYGDETETFLPTIVSQRGARLEAISTYDFPKIVR